VKNMKYIHPGYFNDENHAITVRNDDSHNIYLVRDDFTFDPDSIKLKGIFLKT
jgi:hypothetical protein